MKSFETVEFQTQSIADADQAIEATPRQLGERSWIRERGQQHNDILLNTTLTWMARLPKDVHPMVLARRYPRIVNHIANIWRRVARCEEYLDTLVVDRRGTRTGFPPAIIQELNNLKGYYAELHPDNRFAWDHIGAET